MSPSQELKVLVLKRCTSIEEELRPGIQQNKRLAAWWGTTHIATGMIAALCSSLSAVLTFSNNQTAVILFALVSTALTSCLTFLNPSAREVKRMTTANLIRTELNRLEQDRIFINAPSSSEDMILARMTEITERFESLMKDLIRLL
jgi:hypothetical protein